MSITHYYVRATNGADVAGQGTTHATAYQTPQFALDDIGATHGQGAEGDQINICDAAVEGANTLAGSLSLVAYGTPALARPLVFRGYTATADDGGVGEIDCGGNPLFAAVYSCVTLIHLHCHTFGDNNGITLSASSTNTGGVFYCEVDKGASSPSAKTLVANSIALVGCYLHDAGTGGRAASNCLHTWGNFVTGCRNGIGPGYSLVNNIIVLTENGGTGIITWQYVDNVISNNIVYSTVANTGNGIYVYDTSGRMVNIIQNNIICGFSGAGGSAVRLDGENVQILGYNALYNNTNNLTYGAGGMPYLIDLTAHDVALAADPFTDAANGDFSLTEAARTALAAKGWPTSYLGAHANTVPNLNIGPIQMAASAGGSSVYRRVMRLIGG